MWKLWLTLPEPMRPHKIKTTCPSTLKSEGATSAVSLEPSDNMDVKQTTCGIKEAFKVSEALGGSARNVMVSQLVTSAKALSICCVIGIKVAIGVY